MGIEEIKKTDGTQLLQQIRERRKNLSQPENINTVRSVSELQILLKKAPSNPLTEEDEEIVKTLLTIEFSNLFKDPSTDSELIILWVVAVDLYWISVNNRYSPASVQSRSAIAEVFTGSTTDNDSTFSQSGQNDSKEQQDSQPDKKDESPKDESK